MKKDGGGVQKNIAWSELYRSAINTVHDKLIIMGFSMYHVDSYVEDCDNSIAIEDGLYVLKDVCRR